MKRARHLVPTVVLSFMAMLPAAMLPAVMLPVAMLIGVTPGMAQSGGPTGKLRIKVSPKQAYVFVDGKAVREGSQTIVLTSVQHEVTVENYGYLPHTETVQISPALTLPLEVTLQKSGDEVPGPFGDIEFTGHPRAAVLLNGTTPGYFVGHVDEFDNNFIWHQWLLVQAGTYQATVTEKGQTIWSGTIPVTVGERVIVDLKHGGRMSTRSFKQGLTLGPQPRFSAGIASARVDVGQATAEFSASPTQLNGGQSAALNWKTTDAAETTISNIGSVAPSGNQMVSPCRTTTYDLVAKGPGGETKRSATINVNDQPAATLSLSQTQITYHKVGDQVVEQGTATLSWTSTNASSVTIQPFGAAAPNGSQSIQAAPGQTSSGAINRDVTYTLQAANACGGTVTRTATLHIGGSIDPAPAAVAAAAAAAAPPVILTSVFYPSNYPDKNHPDAGLMASEKSTLADAAAEFKRHEQLPGAQPSELLIVGHTDTRGSEEYNLALSERRVELAKKYLISQGIAADKVKAQADGVNHQLDQRQVDALQAQNPRTPPKWMGLNARDKKATVMAYNRRVDIVLEPLGQRSKETYPNDATDVRLLWQRAQAPVKEVEAGAAAKTKATTKAKPKKKAIAKEPSK